MVYTVAAAIASLSFGFASADSVHLAIHENFPDPCMILADKWYAFSTTSGGLNIPNAYSPDFQTWTVQTGVDAMPDLPAWVYPPNPAVASPDVNQLSDGSYVVYFDAVPTNNTWRRCVGAATSESVAGPYTPVSETLACGDNKYGFIDPSGFFDRSTGLRYILFKLDGTNPGPPSAPLTSVPAEIFIQQVSASDGTTLIGSPISILQSEGGAADYGTVEAPSLITDPSKSGYILFYSSGYYQNSTYTVSYATADSITGPYSERTVLLATGDDGLVAPGGADVARGGKRMVFHGDAGATFNDTRYMYTAEISISGSTVDVV